MTELSELIAKVKELLPKVTPGPWQRSGVRQNITENCIMVGPDGFNIVAIPHGRHPKDHAGAFVDAAYIALLNPTTVSALLSRIEELEAEVTRYQELLDAAIDDYNNARNTALEEAAKICDGARDNLVIGELPHGVAVALGAAIRALIPKQESADG